MIGPDRQEPLVKAVCQMSSMSFGSLPMTIGFR